MSNHPKLPIILAMTIVASYLSSGQSACADEPEEYTISGRVVDSAHNPVKGAAVKLINQHGVVLESQESTPAGTFALVHKPTQKCILEVIPISKTGMATALMEGVPGDKNRSFVVELHRGFEVSGRVTREGKPLKGLQVEALPLKEEKETANIHGGGFAVTGRDGGFQFTLTPGRKKLNIKNERYFDLVSHHDLEITVRSETQLPEIFLPAVSQESHK